MSSRIVNIDWQKSIAILSVILYHCGCFNNYFTISLFSACIPLFFIINGALCLQKDYEFSTILWRNLHLLFIVAFWGTISSLIYMYYRQEPISAKAIISHICSLDLCCTHLWFVCTLIILNFFQPFIRAFIKTHTTRDLIIAWGIISIISFQGASTFLRPIAFTLNWNGYSLFYYIGGYLLITDKLGIKRLSTGFVTLLVVIGFLLMLLHNWLLTANDWWCQHFLHGDMFFNSYCTYPCALLALAIFELFSRMHTKEVGAITCVAKYTFAIYLIHWPLLVPIKHLMGDTWIRPIVVFIASLSLGFLLDRIPYIRRIVQNK